MKVRDLIKRKEEVAAKRLVVNLVLVSILALLTTACAVSFAKLMPMVGEWTRLRSAKNLTINDIQAPCLLSIKIKYEGTAPEDIRLLKGLKGTDGDVKGISVNDNSKEKTITVEKEIEKGDTKDYILSVKPADNTRLKYDVQRLPSKKEVPSDLKAITAKDGSLWISIRPQYTYAEDGADIAAAISVDDGKYMPYIYEGTIKNGEHTVICISDLLKAAKYADDNHLIRIKLSEPKSKALSEKKIAVNSWPEYNSNDKTRLDKAVTEEYLKKKY